MIVKVCRKSSGQNGFPQTVQENLKAFLERDPRERSHYVMMSSDNSRLTSTTTAAGCVYLDFRKSICNFMVQKKINFSWLNQKRWDSILPIIRSNMIEKQATLLSLRCQLCHSPLPHVNFGKNLILHLKLENVTFVKPASTFDVQYE
jgi:hypothetical protein